MGRSVSPANSAEEQVISANSSPGAAPATAVVRPTSCTTMPELLEENEKLRKENVQLSNELGQLKGLCNNILALMSNYASGQLDNMNVTEGKALELMPGRKTEDGASKAEETGEMDVTPRLFGVSIGSKRVRREDEGQKNQQQQQLLLPQNDGERGSDMKVEPSDGSSDQHQDPPWLELNK